MRFGGTKKEGKPGTLKSIIKQMGLNEEEFKRL